MKGYVVVKYIFEEEEKTQVTMYSCAQPNTRKAKDTPRSRRRIRKEKCNLFNLEGNRLLFERKRTNTACVAITCSLHSQHKGKRSLTKV